MEDQKRPLWIAITAFLTLFFLWGGGYLTSFVFFAALLKYFKWSHAYVASLNSALSLTVGLMAPIVGWLMDRMGARLVMGTGTVLAAVGMLAASRSSTYSELLASNIVLGVGLGAASWIPATILISNWFVERRGTILGISTFGKEVGGMLMTISAGYLVVAAGWRVAYMVLALPMLIVILPLMIIVVRARPQGVTQGSASKAAASLPGLEVGEALRTRTFWMLLGIYIICTAVSIGVGLQLVAYLTGMGFSLTAGATAVGLMTAVSGIGKAALGALGDRIGAKNALTMSISCMAAGIALLLAVQNTWMLALFLFVFGIGCSAHHVLVPLALGESIGLKRFGTLFGWVGASASVGLFIGPLMVGWVFDYTGSYRAAYLLCIALCLLGATAAFFSVPFATGREEELSPAPLQFGD